MCDLRHRSCGCDYLDFLPKRPQGTTKILGTPAFAGTKTPTALKSLAKGATTDCAETPVNCPHCGQKGLGRASVPTPTLYPAFFFGLEKAVKGVGNAVIPTFPTHWSHGLQHLRHKRRNIRFGGLRRVHTCLRQQDRTQRLTRRNTGRFGWGRYYYPRSVPHVSETLRGQVSERQTLPLLGLGRRRS